MFISYSHMQLAGNNDLCRRKSLLLQLYVASFESRNSSSRYEHLNI